MLNVIMLNVIIRNVDMLNVVMLSVVAPPDYLTNSRAFALTEQKTEQEPPKLLFTFALFLKFYPGYQ
jgi:hypothetical protein